LLNRAASSFRDRLLGLGKLIAATNEKWRKAIQAANIKPD